MANDVSQHNTIIIGAGPAGLAVGACLTRAGIPCLILEQRALLGAAWHRHYDRLHLHTDKTHSALPLLPFPKEYPRYPSRAQVISYLETYGQHFQLHPRFGQQVVAACPAQGGWDVQTQDTHYHAVNLVVATGYTRVPHIPSWPGQAAFQGRLLHSADYRNGAAFMHQQVLVVGFGNSGGEIALDLSDHGSYASLAVRSPVNVIPREIFGLPILAFGIAQRHLPARVADALNAPLLRAVVGDLTRYGLRTAAYGPVTQIERTARIPLIDIGTIRLIKRGQIKVYPGIERFTESGVVFSDGRRAAFDAVILATGYRPQVSAFLTGAGAAYDAHGTPLQSGREASISGLYFCGYAVAPTGMLREIGREAQQISAAIVRKHGNAART